jgi:Ca2+-binding RTX toxin-like protein
MLGSDVVLRAGHGSSAVRSLWRRRSAVVAALGLIGLMVLVALGVKPADAATAPVFANQAPDGQGFTITPGDLKFILKQIKIAEHHAATLTPDDPCGTLVGSGPDQIPDRLASFGLRTVDGSCNNLYAGRERFAAADQPFPRLTNPKFRAAEGAPAGFFGPGSPAVPSSTYAQKKGSVFDSQPRVISNLIVDQTSTNPAAVQAAEFPVRTQNNPGLHPCTTEPNPTADPPVLASPPDCIPAHKTLFIPNVTTDVGLSPPYNSLFTFFGQFFDHGVDQTVKSGGTVFVPLRADDPLVTLGADGRPNTGDEVPPSQRFMVLTRAQNQPGPDGILGDRPGTAADESADDIQDANNTDSPWVDQSQTYTSHSSHQVFLREYVLNAAGHPVDTGHLLGGLTGTNGETAMATWASVKDQAARRLGLRLGDRDVLNIPMIAADPYGDYLPGPARGLPQYVTATGLVEGDLANPVPVPANVRYFDTPFLTDIAHNADPSPQDTDHDPGTPPVAPTPDTENPPVASADFAAQPPGTYDDEMLDAHFAAGDGRVNENIALTAVHQVFHSEHDRLVGYIKGVLLGDTSPGAAARLAEWQVSTAQSPDGWNGQRLFQAARFVTEMEYQHLVFEEFGRKVQPAIKPFSVYEPDVNAAIPAEFAHAVYRFGHSMLDDDVARVDEATTGGPKRDNSLPLLRAFLNPPEYFNRNNGTTAPYTPEQAAGSIFLGSSDQVGNELDEFVTETLRNNLLGLPLDLPTLNMTRARDAGVPPLNSLRRQIFDETQDSQVAPYTSWTDYGEHLKHAESLANFIAAYGKHPTITSQSTLAGKRNAAKAIADPLHAPAGFPVPTDAADFMFSTGNTWSNAADDSSRTGLDDVDLWVGGLAENTNINGGLLGSTFNYVFESTMQKLQDGDRLYYLARTPGLNLRAQLEGNSFAELIQRNTDGTHSLKADAFSTADCRFELRNLAGTAAAYLANGSTVADDPNSDCDESKLLLRKPDGTIQYRQFNTEDPSGINGQGVYNGTQGVDRMTGGLDNDTFWGGAGADRIEGNPGDDVVLGGDGRDTITDLAGDDVLKGGAGRDSIEGGIGLDLLLGGDGSDFLNGGQNDNEEFGGPGDDFIIAGTGLDVTFGDGGDDWIQGGSGQDLLIGDHAAPFFDDPGEGRPGNDVLVGQVGENDYDSEGGDDIMSLNAAVDRNAGSGGFDWAIHQYDTVGGDDDMAINANLLGLPLPVVVNRDRWQEVEGNSGSRFNDVIRGDDNVPAALGGAGFTGCDVLDAEGVARIRGLNAIVPPLTGALAPVVANSAAGECPLTGPIWGDGNILLGGGGSDTITGRGGDDIIDGDRILTVRISVRSPSNRAIEIGTTDLMEKQYLRNATTGALTGPTLQSAVAAGTVDPADLVVTREINVAPEAGTDTAVFLGTRADYDVTFNANGRVLVTQTGPLAVGQRVTDGTDTLRNIERIQFSDQTLIVTVPNAPTNVTGTGGNGSAAISWIRATANGGPAITSQEIVVSSGATVVQTITGLAPAATTRTITGLTNGTAYTFQVRAVNEVGAGPLSAPSAPITPRGPPAAPTAVTATRGNAQATVSWTAPANDGGSPITAYQVQVRIGAVVQFTDLTAGVATSRVISGLNNGQAYNFRVLAVNEFGPGAPSVASAAVTPATVPGPPLITSVVGGVTTDAPINATVNWDAPADTGGSPITSYTVRALRMAADGTTVLQTTTVANIGQAQRTRTVAGLVAGAQYRFEVVAVNAVGSTTSARSALVTAN